MPHKACKRKLNFEKERAKELIKIVEIDNQRDKNLNIIANWLEFCLIGLICILIGYILLKVL